MTRVSLLCLALCLGFAHAFAQLTDSLTYPEVRVEAHRIVGALGTRQTDTDSLLLQIAAHQDLSTVLQLQGNVQVRSYGTGGIATFSMRGTTAAHTQVAWMGIPINDPMLGLSDLGTMPMNGLGGVRLLRGAAAMPNNSGGIGGTIELIEQSPRIKDGITAQVLGEWGAFETYAAGAGLQLRKKRWWANTAINYRTAANNFSYTDQGALNKPTRIMTHANMRLWGIAQTVGFDINRKHVISMHFRMSETNRLLPATMLQVASKETLLDRDTWLAARYGFKGKLSVLEATSAYIRGEQQYFGNDDYLYPYLYQANKNIVRYKLALHSKVDLKVGADISSEHARSDTAYGNTSGVWRHWQALYISATYSPAYWARMQALVREDLINGTFSPIQALGGVEVDALKWLRLSANVSRNFRAPSLNDLYWKPGGNADLKNETGFSTEAGIVFHKHWQNFGFKVHADWFRTDVNNWILWNPGVGNVWSPQNLRRVLAQGVETTMKLTTTAGKVKLALHAEYSFTSSTIEESNAANGNEIGRQLIYTPLHSARGHISLLWKGLTFLYGHAWTGARFTSSDNLSFLPSYNLGWVAASYRLPIKQHAIQLGAVLDNIYGHEYQSIAWRPMPGRSWRISLVYSIGN